jgi:uncharacterized protein (TIGR02246 family)
MKIRQELLAGVFAIVCLSGAQADEASDEAIIRQGVVRWEEAWNKHDAKAGAELFADNADFINVNASFWKGRAEIEDSHAKLFSGMFKESTFKTLGSNVRFLSPDTALAHIKWEIAGDTSPDGSPRPPRQGIFTQVLTKQNDRWLIAAWHNTNIIVLPGHPVPPSANLPTLK